IFERWLLLSCLCSFNTKMDFKKHFCQPSDLYKETIGQFKKLQMQDGRFGNVYTTAVITQALIASGQEHAKDWKLNTTIKYFKVDCSANPRKHGDDPVSKVRLQYSLYIGDNKNVVHTIYLKVPDNSTAAEVMKLAEVEDPKYKCKQENMSGKTYVYEIANIANDPENGKFWLLYVGESNQTESLHRTNLSPEKLTLSNGQHLVFWYKTASL
ncbi:uncharacterized protein CDAR_480591, partial [Caerostris darwini]